jgi:predicted nucleotidyltransferase
MASGNYKQYIKNPEGQLVNTKKYLYVLRPIFACMWIDLHNSIPPMKFSDIYENFEVRQHIGNVIYGELIRLIFLKQTSAELNNQPRNELLDSFIEEQLDKYFALTKDIEIEVSEEYKFIDTTFQQLVKGELL